jgi:hypothetical protein
LVQLQHTLVVCYCHVQQPNLMCCPAQVVCSLCLCTRNKAGAGTAGRVHMTVTCRTLEHSLRIPVKACWAV